MQPWRTRSRRTFMHDSRYLTIEHHQIELPDGRTVDDWPWVITPDYTCIAAFTVHQRFICFRQTKYAVAGTALAPPAGYLEAGEAPLACAQRELREETGHVADDWESLGAFAVDGNRGCGTAHLFLARTAREVETGAASDDWEEQEMVLLTPAQVDAALRAGEFKVLGWTAVMALALRRLER